MSGFSENLRLSLHFHIDHTSSYSGLLQIRGLSHSWVNSGDRFLLPVLQPPDLASLCSCSSVKFLWTINALLQQMPRFSSRDLADVTFCSEEWQLLKNTHLLGMHVQKPFIFCKETNELIEDVKDCILLLLKLSTIETVLAKPRASDKVGGLSWAIWECTGDVF